MNNKYYDRWEFKKILSTIYIDLEQTIIRFEDYLKRYPKDYSAYSYYASALITLGFFDKANSILDYVESVYTNDYKYLNIDDEKIKTLKCNILYARIKLLCYQEKYNELIDLYNENYEYTKNLDIDKIYFYCKIKAHMIEFDNRERYSYLYRQASEYKKSDFLYHVQKHCDDYVFDEDEKTSIFNRDFPIYKITNEIDKYLLCNKRLFYGFVEDTYFFKYNECGLYKGKTSSFFKVICFHNTKNIITMYPIYKSDNLPYIDLNYLKEEIMPKVKRRSQIDKFNDRYGIK